MVQESETISSPEIAGLPSVVFDMHVPEGREAIALFIEECEDVRRILRTYPREHWGKLVGVILFNQEGGDVLRQSLSYPTQRALLSAAQSAHLASNGMTNHMHQDELSVTIMGNLDILNDLRRKVAAPSNQPSLI